MRILYLMHVDWNWIKQRPHFIAEKLSKTNRVLVLFRINPKRSSMVDNKSHINKIPFIPIPRRGKALSYIDKVIQKQLLRIITFFVKPEYIWVTFPHQYNYIPKRLLKNSKIIYDCMDDAPSFYESFISKQEILLAERKMVESAFLTICSSENLKKIIEKRYGVSNVTVVRNALPDSFVEKLKNEDTLEETTSQIFQKQDNYIDVVYIGTVANWIDYDSIIYCLNKMKNVRFHFIGPIEKKHQATGLDDQIIYHGPIDHDKLISNKNQYDILIMPFVLNELIESVDPVKLYEYISFEKEIVSVYYDEIRRFEKFVHFYNNREDLYNILKSLSENKAEIKNVKKMALPFLKENTWTERVNQIEKEMELRRLEIESN